MSCLICNNKTNKKLCDRCNTYYIYDKKYDFIRKKKHLTISIKDHVKELLLYLNICKIYGRKNTYRNVHFLWAKGTKGTLLEYDIVVPDKRLLFEFDGEQHFKYPNFFHKSREEFKEQIGRDKLKNKLAKENGYKLIRLNYKNQIDEINVRRKIDVYSTNHDWI